MEAKTYDYIMSLGFNCEPAFQFLTKFGFLESSMFGWAAVRNVDLFFQALDDTAILLSGKLRYEKTDAMVLCEESGVSFHGKFIKDQVTGVDGELLPEKKDAVYGEIQGRISYLVAKQNRIWSSNHSQLYILAPFTDLSGAREDGDEAKLQRYISRASSILARKNERATLLAVVLDEHLESLKHLENERLYIRGLAHYTPRDKVTNVELSDREGWEAVWKEFQPGNIPAKNKARKPDAKSAARKKKQNAAAKARKKAAAVRAEEKAPTLWCTWTALRSRCSDLCGKAGVFFSRFRR